MYLDLILAELNRLVNLAITLSPQASPYSKKLVGKTITVNIATIQQTVHIVGHETGVLLHNNRVASSDVVLSAPIPTLIALSLHKHPNLSDYRNLKITGNIHLLQTLTNLLKNIELDLTDEISKVIGDLPASFIKQTKEAVTNKRKEVLNNLLLNLSEYLQEELRCLPPRLELNDFFDDVDKLKLRAEHLQIRLKELAP